jgi:hypothetical protein
VLRGGLIVLALVVAGGFILVLLPQGAFERLAQRFKPATIGSEQKTLAFLYLGDEFKNNEFHIRGVVRNISTEPLEKVDATVRIYATAGSLLETTVVRMDKERIPPDGVAQFDLVYPGYKGEFGSYSVEFKTRSGQALAYEDMRSD